MSSRTQKLIQSRAISSETPPPPKGGGRGGRQQQQRYHHHHNDIAKTARRRRTAARGTFARHALSASRDSRDGRSRRQNVYDETSILVRALRSSGDVLERRRRRRQGGLDDDDDDDGRAHGRGAGAEETGEYRVGETRGRGTIGSANALVARRRERTRASRERRVVAVDRENRTDLHSKRIVARGFRTFESDVDESRIEA